MLNIKISSFILRNPHAALSIFDQTFVAGWQTGDRRADDALGLELHDGGSSDVSRDTADLGDGREQVFVQLEFLVGDHVGQCGGGLDDGFVGNLLGASESCGETKSGENVEIVGLRGFLCLCFAVCGVDGDRREGRAGGDDGVSVGPGVGVSGNDFAL